MFPYSPVTIPDSILESRQQTIYAFHLLLTQIAVLMQNIPKNKKLEVNDAQRILLARVFKELSYPEELLIAFKPSTLKIWERIFFHNAVYPRSKTGRPPTHIIIRNIIMDFKLKNQSWGYGKILGELKKLKIKVCKTTVKNILKQDFPDFLNRNDRWRRFLERQFKISINRVVACDFKKIHQTNGTSLFVLFFISLCTREILHFNVTSHPSKNWIENQMRELNSIVDFNRIFLVHDRDALFKQVDFLKFDIRQIKTPKRQPEYNPVSERFIGSFKREVLKHYDKDSLDENSLYSITKDYIRYHNRHRPHQGIGNITIEEYKEQLLNPDGQIPLTKTLDHYRFMDLKSQSFADGLCNHYFFAKPDAFDIAS